MTAPGATDTSSATAHGAMSLALSGSGEAQYAPGASCGNGAVTGRAPRSASIEHLRLFSGVPMSHQ